MVARLNLFVSPYKLMPFQAPNARSAARAREGALLKIVEADGMAGYADIHPWPELGETSLADQLAALRAGSKTSLLERSIALAEQDAEARREKRSLWSADIKLKNNLLVADCTLAGIADLQRAHEQGFELVKIKCGRDHAAEAKFVNEVCERTGLRVRLDFNATASEQGFADFFAQLGSHARARIEYVEDPTPFSEKSWNRIRSLVPVALDQEWGSAKLETASHAACDVLVLKPARQNVEKAVDLAARWDLRLAVTSMMDHPVGVAHAMCTALELRRKFGESVLQAGCLTSSLYESNPFSERMRTHGPLFAPVMGTGIGFDDLLESQAWMTITSL